MRKRTVHTLALAALTPLAACQQKQKPAPEPAAAPAAPARPSIAEAIDDDMTGQYLLDLAMVHQRHKGYERALDLLEVAAARESDAELKAQIQMRRGEVLQAADRGDEALESYEAASAGLKDPAERARVLLRLGQQYRQAKRHEDAARVLDEAYKNATQPHTRDAARAELVQVWNAAGSLEARIADLEQQLAAKPADVETMRVLAIAHGQSGKPDKALELFRKLTVAQPDEPSHLQNFGNYAYQAGKFAEGIEAFKKLADKAPHARSQAYERIASGYANLKQNAVAMQWAEKLGALATPQTPYIYVQQGNLLGRIGQPERAVAAFDKAIEAAPTPAQKEDFRFQLATFYVAQRQMERAIALLGELSTGPGSEPLKQNAGRLLESLKQQQQAQSGQGAPAAQ